MQQTSLHYSYYFFFFLSFFHFIWLNTQNLNIDKINYNLKYRILKKISNQHEYNNIHFDYKSRA